MALERRQKRSRSHQRASSMRYSYFYCEKLLLFVLLSSCPLVDAAAFTMTTSNAALQQQRDHRAPITAATTTFSASSSNNNAGSSAAFTLVRANVEKPIEDDFTINRQEEVDAIAALRKCSCIDDVRGIWNVKKKGSKSPNVAAAALKRITQLSSSIGATSTEKVESTTENLLSEILEKIVSALVIEDNENSSSLSVYAAADCLVSLSIQSSRKSAASREKLAPIMLLLWGRLDDDAATTVRTLSPKRLVDCLRSCCCCCCCSVASGIVVVPTQEICSTNLYHQMCHRLSQGDAVAQLSAVDLATLLRVVLVVIVDAAAVHCKAAASSSSSSSSTLLLLKAVARRFRKQAVREAASTRTILQALDSTRRLCLHTTVVVNENDDTTWLQEIRVMAYTLTKQLVSSPTATNGTTAIVAPVEAATIFQTVRAVLDVNATDPLVQELSPWLQQRIQYWQKRNQFVSVGTLAQILSALEQWQVRDVSALLYDLGNAFQDCIQDEKNRYREYPRLPRGVNTILRCAALLQGNDEVVMRPFLMSARLLFLDHKFLERCGPVELSNFVWIAAFKACHFFDDDDEVLLSLAHRILDDDVVEGCTPKLACRILNALSALLVGDSLSDGAAPRHFSLLSDVFGSLGEHLLSTQLTPLDASSAIYAYAKSSYNVDMGIFDHLVDVLACQVSDCTFRQVSQGLWACGKMMAWECDLSADGDWDVSSAAVNTPPFLSSATRLATYLSHHVDDLSTKDLSQALWAMARLRIDDAALVDPLVERVESLSSELTTREVANIVWALSKLRRKDFKTIFVLTRRFVKPSISIMDTTIKPQEAANVLYALAKMDVRDDQVFQSLTDVILDRIDCTSAQAVANVLWAHRAVYMEPPSQLLDTWASRKLGLVAISPPQNVEYLY